MPSRNSVLPATAMSHAAVLRSRHPPSTRTVSSRGVVAEASLPSFRANVARRGAVMRRTGPPSWRYRRTGVT